MTKDSTADDTIESAAESAALAVSSTYKVRGEFTDTSGTGVLGMNNAESGTPIGVEGAVPNNTSGGYGLSTPHDARVQGTMATSGTWQVDVDGDRAIELTSSGTFTSNNTTLEGSGSTVVGHLNQISSGVLGASIGGGGLYNVDNDTTSPNTVTDHFNTVGGGFDNTAGDSDSDLMSAFAATIGGGRLNTASARTTTVAGGSNNTASGRDSTVGGGSGNRATGTNGTVGGGNINVARGSNATIGGGNSNSTSGSYATIAGGGFNVTKGRSPTIGGGNENDVFDDYGTVAGGQRNQAGTNDSDTTTAKHATVAGGVDNTASADEATVGGGSSNTASRVQSTVGGGANNSASGVNTTIAGGFDNGASASNATVGGGTGNTASAGNTTVGGGKNNTASGSYATVAGGLDNTASGDYGFAGGRLAEATNNGSFVWSDSDSSTFSSSGPDQFLVDAGGGVGIGTNSPGSTLDVDGTAALSSASVSGTATMASAKVENDATLGSASVSGTATMASATVNNDAAMGSASVSGTATMASATVNSNASVSGDLDVGGTIKRDAMTQVYLGSLFSVPTTSETTLALSSETIDEPAAWDGSNYEYTCPQNGHYEISVNIKFSSTFSSDTRVILRIRNNGSLTYKWDGTAFAGEDFERSYTATLVGLAAGDTLNFTIQQNSGGDKDMLYGQTGTRASIRYLGTGTN